MWGDDHTLLRGFPPVVDDAAKVLIAAKEAAQAVAAAEQRACAEDRRIAIAAYDAGKFPASRIDFWCDAMRRDREGNRAIVAPDTSRHGMASAHAICPSKPSVLAVAR
jgi:hypothetical protein